MKRYCPFILCSILLVFRFGAAAQVATLIGDINPGTPPSDPGSLTPFNGKLIFIATNNTTGRELWSYSGTGVPTLVHDLYPGTGNGAAQPGIRPLGVLGTKLYFSGSNGSGTSGGTTASELFVYDGINPPSLAADIQPGIVGTNPKDFATMGGKLYFSANALNTTGAELYSYDGVDTPVVHELVPGNAGSYPAGLTVYNGKLYFSAVMTGVGQELCVYDPVGDTVSLVSDIEAGVTSSYPVAFTVAAGKLWFGARTSSYGMELYSYDGSNVVRVTDLTPGLADGLYSIGVGAPTVEIGALNNKVYFAGVEDDASSQLYCHDPATGVTSLVATINPSGSSTLKYLTELGGRLYFRADDGTHGNELWMTDGSTTSLVADINPGTNSSNPINLTAWNGVLYMRADNGTTGNELYRLQDGTGIASAAFGGSVQLYPNPAMDLASLELTLPKSEMIGIGLYDETGKMLWSKPALVYPAGKTDLKIPLMGLSSGIYFYRLWSGDGRALVVGKVEKQ